MAKKKESAPTKASMAKNAVKQINMTFGENTINALGSKNIKPIEGISTGSLALDMAISNGAGVPRGRIIEIIGPESAGKTSLCSSIIAQCQKKGGIAAFIDVEHAFDPAYARTFGVNIDTLLVSQPTFGEEAFQIMEALIRSNAIDVIVLDSVAGLLPRSEGDGEVGDRHVGLVARLMSQGMRKLVGAIADSKTTVIFTNQIRFKIGVKFGSPETTPGGNALKFFASVRLDVRRKATLSIGSGDDEKEAYGIRMKVKVVKNKVAPPFKTAETDLLWDSGLSMEGDILDMALADKLIKQSGAWFSYKDSNIGQGRLKAVDFLRENQQITEEIKAMVIKSRTQTEEELVEPKEEIAPE